MIGSCSETLHNIVIQIQIVVDVYTEFEKKHFTYINL